MRPSYMSWVRRGVIISTVRSTMMSESNGADGAEGSEKIDQVAVS
jgi:hypothetical protein